MLRVAKSLKELNFSSLMDVYMEGNQEKAEESALGLHQGLLQADQHNNQDSLHTQHLPFLYCSTLQPLCKAFFAVLLSCASML